MLYHLLDYGHIFHRRKVSFPAQHHHWRYQELKLVEEGAPEEALDLGKQLGLLEVSEVFEAELLLDEGYVEGEKLGDVTEDGHGLLGRWGQNVVEGVATEDEGLGQDDGGQGLNGVGLGLDDVGLGLRGGV